MNEQQRTFGEDVGMEPVVPTRPHPDDLIVRSDGSEGAMCDSHADYNGDWHCTEEECHESDVTIMTEFLNGVAEWVCSYAREHEDYTSGFDHIIGETSYHHPSRVDEWLAGRIEDYTDIIQSAYNSGELELNLSDEEGGEFDSDEYIRNIMDMPDTGCVIQGICAVFDNGYDGDWKFDGDENSAYYGDGCCLLSVDIGECEEQLGISDHDILKHFHDKGNLDDILDDVNSDLYISRSKRRVKNEETGYYEGVGRETYDPYGSDYPDVMVYIRPGGQWHYVVSDERMEEILTDVIIDLVS